MDPVIDLDAAAQEIRRRSEHWRALGHDVGAITWADGQTTVHKVTTDRSQVRGDYSIGVHVTRGEQEGFLVLYAGGWCDLLYWSGDAADEPVDEAPGWEDRLDIGRFNQVLDRFERLFANER